MFSRIKSFALAAALIGGVVGLAVAANNWPGANNLGTPITFCSYDIGSGIEANCTVQTDVKGNSIYGTDGSASQLVVCNQEAQYDTNTSGKTQIVALASGKKIYVCGYSIVAAGTVSVDLTQGTGTNCATGTNTKMTPTYQLATAGVPGVLDPSTTGATTGPNVSIASQALCIETNAAVAVQARVKFAQF